MLLLIVLLFHFNRVEKTTTGQRRAPGLELIRQHFLKGLMAIEIFNHSHQLYARPSINPGKAQFRYILTS